MSLMRAALLRASRSEWLADQFRKRAFARRAVRRFMPGESVDAAVEAATALAAAKLTTVLTALGERVLTRAEAEEVRAHYLGVLDVIRDRTLPTHLSVKLTHLGLDVDTALCAELVESLAHRCAAIGTMLWLDMEESHYVDATLELYHRVRARHPGVGVCLQAYLKRTPADLDAVLAAGGSVRLVKGAYREPPAIAFARKSDTDAAYFVMAQRMLESATPDRVQVFGTHDLTLVTRIREAAAAHGIAAGAWEVHMLYGIHARDQRALAADGLAVRVLISYGTHWFPWYMRRLAERPANVWFVVRSLVS